LDTERDDKYQLNQLFEQYHAALVLYSISIVKDKDDAEDIVQHAFISLWRKIRSLDVHSSGRAYLYKSVYHGSLDLLKHRKVRKRHEEEVKNNKQGVPAHSIGGDQLQEEIESAVNELPDQCRKIFKMSRYEQLRYREIAIKLNISEKTVENQMGRAFKLLKEILKDHYARRQ